jgi:hypothetical protein
MVPENNQPSVENQQRQAKKLYRKPCVQEYGTLREMTLAGPKTDIHGPDGGANPGGAPKNRT